MTDADFAELKKHYSETQIVDIVAVIALFGFLNRFNDTMATELETSPLEAGKRYLAARLDGRQARGVKMPFCGGGFAPIPDLTPVSNCGSVEGQCRRAGDCLNDPVDLFREESTAPWGRLR